MRRVFMVPVFAKWVRKKRIPDSLLCGAVQECVDGLIDAEFVDVLKKRIGLNNQGKRGSARTIIAV